MCVCEREGGREEIETFSVHISMNMLLACTKVTNMFFFCMQFGIVTSQI